ncbi:hypothetical protein WR25_22023 [Diploscapter pachys]|uniref:Uncharacterized protein n=1 Tax=Diploscapter pachys TaxID=2018661 RepID=A0A2A2JRE0_9BILA|nr:hypothetical protein WR25_22023 [Diploscapter pachys]
MHHQTHSARNAKGWFREIFEILHPLDIFDVSLPTPVTNPMKEDRNVLVVRHGERVDFTFKKSGTNWLRKAFDSTGRYKPYDINLPRHLPKREGGQRAFEHDTPLTEIGYLQSKLTGRAIKEAGIKIDYVFCSPALRCVQTAVGLLKGLGLDGKIRLNVEPGLFEWLVWLKHVPKWMTPEELKHNGYPVNPNYETIFSEDHLNANENLPEYYERSHKVMREVLKKCPLGNVMVVAHGASLDTCTRQLTGGMPRMSDEFYYLLQNTPYLASTQIVEKYDGSFQHATNSIQTLTHGDNYPYDAQELQASNAVIRENAAKFRASKSLGTVGSHTQV